MGGVYTSADLLQDSPLLRVASAEYAPKNRLLSDPIHQMQPFLAWNRDELRQGRLPLWNPYNFLRRLALAHAAALVGAVAYTFGGYHIVWLSWVQVGAAVCLPAGAYCVERALQAARPGLGGAAQR